MSPFVYKLMTPLILLFVVGVFACDWSIANVGISLIFWFIFGCVGVEITLHRYFSHRAFELNPWMEKFVTVASIPGAQHSPIWWSALHVTHHREADSDHDVHSPKRGFWYALIGWYVQLDPKSVSLKPCGNLIRDPFQIFIHKHYYTLFWVPIVGMGLIDWQLAYFIFVVPSFLAFMQTNLVNCFCHLSSFGYRTFDTPDNSRNVPLIGYLSWGLGFHNNHHAFPSDPRLGRKWWEIDVSGYIIPLLAKSGASRPNSET